MGNPGSSGVSEWRRYGSVPIAAALGFSIAVLHIYALGSFILPLQEEFGWSRAFASLGLTISGLSAAVFAIPLGMVIDRVGPRRIGLTGAVLMATGFALFGTATGSKANWVLLWGFLSFANLWAQATVWTSAVASRFERSRGLALAVCLCGSSVAATIFPPLATWLIKSFGWRIAFPSMAGMWLALVFPVILLFFRGAQDEAHQARKSRPEERDQASDSAPVLSGVSPAEGMRSPAFYKLLVASGLFTVTITAIIVHIVPLLTDRGADPLRAAAIASLIGIFSIIGRLGSGFLIDRLPGHLVGAITFALPIIACALLYFDGADPVSQSLATSIFGLTLGAETDVIGYLTSRHFGIRHFGVFFGAMAAALAVGSAAGPLAAGAVFDAYGTYGPFLLLTMGSMAVGSVALATLGRPRFGVEAHDGPRQVQPT